MDGHGHEKGAGADVEPREGDAEEPERDERGGVDVDKREEEAGKEHGQPDRHDFCKSAKGYASEEWFLKKRGFKEKKRIQDRLATR